MSLSKQLYIIISIIFLTIFTGNFIISIQNTKAYLQDESATKAQDTATSLGMTLKPYINDKKDPEIETIIKAISNRGFYKEIRLEDIQYLIPSEKIIVASNELDNNKHWNFTEIKVLSNNGEIQISSQDDELENELDALEDEEIHDNGELKKTAMQKFKFTPSDNFKDKDVIKLFFKASNKNEFIENEVSFNLSKVIVEESRIEKFDDVPQWFINLIPLELNEKSSEINSGWKTSAIIYVSANAGVAYEKLYEQAKSAVIYACIAFIVSMICLIFFLQFILKPLKNIEKLAINISKGKFSTIKKLPYTTEIRNVASAMNEMSTKIEDIITKLNKNIENVTKKISLDELTNLPLRQTFDTDMKKMFISKSSGYILNIKINDLGSFAKNNSNDVVDKYIKEFANILKQSKEELNLNISSYRFFGSEFAMILEKCDYEKTKQVCTYLKNQFDDLGKKYNHLDVSNIGATPFNPIGTTPEMMTCCQEAYEMAKQIGPNEAHIRDDNDLARDMLSWKELISNIISHSTFKVDYINNALKLTGTKEGDICMQEAFTSAFDKDNLQIPIGTFVSIAEKYDKVIDFDKAVIQKVISHIKEDKISHDISINLSLDSIYDAEFMHWLKTLILQNDDIAQHLVFSLTAYAVAKDIKQFKEFVDSIHEVGAKVIIKRFESKFIPLDSLKTLNIDYIRLAREYTHNIHKDIGKKTFVESMQEISNLINIKVFAENVKNEEDFSCIRQLNLYAASK